jgi:hypothetical protein
MLSKKSKRYDKLKIPDRLSKRSMWQQGERNSEEVGVVLQIGNHLEQIAREKEEAERGIATVPVKVEDECVQNAVSRNEDYAYRPEDVAFGTAADEAGTLYYAILGWALEELLPQKVSRLPHNVQKYLQGGFQRVAIQGAPILFKFCALSIPTKYMLFPVGFCTWLTRLLRDFCMTSSLQVEQLVGTSRRLLLKRWRY